LQDHASQGPLDQELDPVSAGRAPPAAIARAGAGYPNPPASDTFCRKFAIAMAGEAKAPGVQSITFTNSPYEHAFAKLAAEDPVCTGSFGLKGCLTRSSAKKSAIRLTQGAFHRGPLSWAMGPQLGEPSQASSSPERWALFHLVVKPCENGSSAFGIPASSATLTR
jgi:hypothetical protein